jgi:hypothetical protein
MVTEWEEHDHALHPLGSDMRIARIRKAIVTALGMAVTLVLLVPEENIPERWRPVVGIVLALGTIFGVYVVSNDRPVTREDLKRTVDYPGPTRFAGPEDRRGFGGGP